MGLAECVRATVFVICRCHPINLWENNYKTIEYPDVTSACLYELTTCMCVLNLFECHSVNTTEIHDARLNGDSPVSALAILMSDMWLNCVDIKSRIRHRVLYTLLFLIGEGFELLQHHTWLCHSLFYSVGSTVMNFSWNYCQGAHGRNVWKACRNYWRICTSCWGKFLEHAQPWRSQVSVETHRQHAMLPHTQTHINKKVWPLQSLFTVSFDKMTWVNLN